MVEVRWVLPWGRARPLALALGLAFAPALAGCILTADKLDPALDVPGKYTRANAASVKADRGERVTQNLGEKVYSIIDELIAIGKELGRSPASIALAWVQGRPGVASTIIGASGQTVDTSPLTVVPPCENMLATFRNCIGNPSVGFDSLSRRAT